MPKKCTFNLFYDSYWSKVKPCVVVCILTQVPLQLQQRGVYGGGAAAEQRPRRAALRRGLLAVRAGALQVPRLH